MAPPRSCDPEMLEVWFGIMCVLAAMGETAMAFMIAVGLSCYFRLGEALGIQIQDVLRPHRSGAGPMSIIIFPQERTAVSKTGETDNSCLLNCNWMTWLPCAILLHIGQLGRTRGNLFDFSYPQFYSAFMIACRRLDIRSVVPYQWRHSGASIDRLKKSRTLDEVRKRGFWKSHKSHMRYEKAGRRHVGFRKYSLDQRSTATLRGSDARNRKRHDGQSRGVSRKGAIPFALSYSLQPRSGVGRRASNAGEYIAFFLFAIAGSVEQPHRVAIAPRYGMRISVNRMTYTANLLMQTSVGH